MLDSVTKKNIDDCRDVLVGKVPDPKSQIEQITLALIYKFMDDMDREAVEKFKGKAKFFTGDHEKYSWRKLFSPSLSGKELIDLYAEALDKLNTNPNIPELFRNIFKNAYLPYRDPATLKLFLKHISEFTYDHSERLGDAFEYLLSVMGSQGDAGQFRTPRNIIDFITACVNPQKHETVADPACGTSGFLLSAYKHILKHNTKAGKLTLTPDEKKKLSTNFTGYDISPDMVRLSLANMFLHDFKNPQIHEYDSLSSEERWNETFDVILANPPFMTPKGGIRPHKKFGVQANKAEVLFTDYIAEHLNPKGRAGIVVPNGIIATTQTAYTQLRRLLVTDSLIAVVSLPAGCFNPYSGVKTSVLLLDKQLIKKAKHVLFIKVANDGFDLGAQRRDIQKNDLPLALEAFEAYKTSIATDTIFDIEKYNNICLLVEKEKILANKNNYLTADTYGEAKTIQTEYEVVNLKDITQIKTGKKDVNQGNPQGKYPFFTCAKEHTYSDSFSFDTEAILIAGNGDVGSVQYFNGQFEAYQRTYVLSNFNNVLPKYLYYVLKMVLKETVSKQKLGNTMPYIKLGMLETFEIPLPPIGIQTQILAEIESYQKVINGCKMILDNYKPTITIKPEWKMAKLETIATFKNGINYTKDEKGNSIKIIGVGDFKNYLIPKIETLEEVVIGEKISNEILLKENDLLFVRSNGNKELVGRCMIIPPLYDDITFTGFSIRLRFTQENILPLFYCYLFRTDFFRNILSGKEGANISNINQERLKEVLIPLPPIEEQNAIVQAIENEQRFISSNKELLDLFEKKIKAKINAVWGIAEEAEHVEPQQYQIEQPEALLIAAEPERD
jgi:type I restriction enzyme M protein